MAHKKYNDKMFIDAVNHIGPHTPYGFAKELKLHHGLLKRRLEELASQGAIVRVSSSPIVYGPKPNKSLPPQEPNIKEKKDFFNQVTELTQIEIELLALLEREPKGLPTSKICKILGYEKPVIHRILNHLIDKCRYIIARKEKRSTYWMLNPHYDSQTFVEETKSMLSVGSLLNIIKNAVTDLESQVEILTAQNEAFKNVSKNTHFKNRTLVDEETIRGDERNRVFVSLGKIMGIGPGVIAGWYKAGK